MRKTEEKTNKYKNLPNVAIDNLETGTATQIMKSLNDLNKICCNGVKASLQTNEQLRESIDNVYRYCIENDVRIGVELLSLALGISRQTFYRWSNGIDCDEERAEICQNARTAVSAFVEQIAFKGKMNPVLSIFALKSIANWQDGSQEQILINTGKNILSLDDLPKFAPTSKCNEKNTPHSLQDIKEQTYSSKSKEDNNRFAEYDFLDEKSTKGCEYI